MPDVVVSTREIFVDVETRKKHFLERPLPQMVRHLTFPIVTTSYFNPSPSIAVVRNHCVRPLLRDISSVVIATTI